MSEINESLIAARKKITSRTLEESAKHSVQ